MAETTVNGTTSATEKENKVKASPVKESTENASPKSSPTKKDIDIATEALNHFAQGKRHFLVNDIASAVNSLQEACRLLGQHYGETAPECGDAYFFYGKALLELARIENGVLGNALDGDEGSTEEEEEESPEDESQEGQEEESQEDKEGETSQDEEGKDDASSQEGDAKENGDEKTEDSDEDEVGNLQLAWEMLELSKVIYQKQIETNPTINLKVAQVYLKLGEVGLENENYPGSIDDFKQCLEIQKQDLKPDDRCLAETNYQLGVAYSFADDFDNAIESFKTAADVIEQRISNLEEKSKEKAEWTDEQKKKYAEECADPFYTEQSEIDELLKLLPEIKEKIVDMEQMRKDTRDKLQKFKQSTFATFLRGSKSEDGASTSSSSEIPSAFSIPSNSPSAKSSSSDKPAANITHLIRKKRKPEDEIEKEDQKKAKVENGDASKDKTTNGHSEVKSKSSPVKESEDEKMEAETVST